MKQPAASLPPGPGMLKSFGFVRRPFAFLDTCARHYGDWFTLRFPGLAPFVFTSDPEAIADVFSGDPEQLYAGEANAPLGAFMGPQSVLFLDGAAHLRQRRLLLPPFHGERMQAYAETMLAITDREIDAWPLGEPFPIHRSFRAITFEVILRTVFGFDEGPSLARLRNRLARLFTIFAGAAGTLIALPALRVDLGRLTPWGRVVRLRRDVDEILYAEFAQRRRVGTGGRADVLSLLLEARDEQGAALSDAVLRDEMLTLMLAGHETTAASLAWVIHRVLQRSDVVAELKAEVARVGCEPQRINDLTYLDAVIKETSRLEPVIPNVGRRLHVPLRIGGRDLPAGPIVAPCIYLAHRRPDSWVEPERFEPERFVDRRINPAAFFPFGGGTRRCLGAAFATYEMKVVLARILSRVELHPAPGYRARLVRRSIAFTPSAGLPVVATERSVR
jgi:cytochrome P450 family 110